MTRLLTLLLITHATAEWVEISQHHYRKPIRTHSLFTTPDKDLGLEDTTKPWINNNRSVTEYNWNKAPSKPPNIGNIKRVQHVGSTEKTTVRVPQEGDDFDLHVDFRNHELRQNFGPTRAIIDLHDKQKGMIERVPNVANIKRVQLNNSPVKSPALSYKGEREKYSGNRHENDPRDEDHDTGNEFEHKNSEAFRRIYVNKVKHHGTERPVTFPPDDDEDTSSSEEATTFNTERPKAIYNNHTTVRDFYSTKPTFITETDDFTSYETQRNRFYKITNSKSSEVTEKTFFTTQIIETEEPTTKISPKSTKPTRVKANINNVPKTINDFKGESHENKIHVSTNEKKQPNPDANDHKTKTKSNKDQPKHDHEIEKDNDKETKDEKGDTKTTTKTEKNKVNTMENVIKFMRVVADTISKNSRKSFSGKMQYLHELKESILANIGKYNYNQLLA